MPTAMALLVGLKNVDPIAYNGWDGTNGCLGCELDVDNVACILRPLGYAITTLKTTQATGDAVLRGLRSAATKLKDGDIFVFYYSGHGGQMLDTNGDEADNQDETLVAYDRQINDDELGQAWLGLKPGVRVVMLSDSCNSGTNYKLIGGFGPPPFFPGVSRTVAAKMQAQMLHFGGCRDAGTSAGYQLGGAFTRALCNVWNGGAFSGNYRAFYDAIRAEVRKTETQEPQHSPYGPVTAQFQNQRPFAVAADSRTAAAAAPARISIALTLIAPDLETAREVARVHLGGCVLDGINNARSSDRGCSVSASGSAGSGGWSVGGGISCTL